MTWFRSHYGGRPENRPPPTMTSLLPYPQGKTFRWNLWILAVKISGLKEPYRISARGWQVSSMGNINEVPLGQVGHAVTTATETTALL
jgi:hypothetical protein